MTHYSYCEFHLGDNQIHLHFLRNLALQNPTKSFVHVVHGCYVEQLAPMIEGCVNVVLETFEWKEKRNGSHPWRNVWKNAGEFWSRHPGKTDYARFYLDWFKKLAKEMGLTSPFAVGKDLLFDYPAITPSQGHVDWIDFLLCNSQPCSGQLKTYDGPDYFRPIIDRIEAAHKSVITTSQIPGWNGSCTADKKMSISDIGRISTTCKAIVGIANGPMWPCLNRWNLSTPTFVILDHVLGEEIITGLKPNMVQVKTLPELIAAIESKGLL
jgi:hypothetical protein